MNSKNNRAERAGKMGANYAAGGARRASSPTTIRSQALRRHSESGFTLIEIIVVITLVTMLAVIAIPNYLEARKESAKSSCISNIKEISNATEQWALEMRKNPNSAVGFEDIHPYLKGTIVCPTGGKTFDDSYSISVVANEPTCQRQPQDHIWMGSTTVAALQNSKAPSSTASLLGDNSGNNGNGNGNGQNNGKGKGNGKGK